MFLFIKEIFMRKSLLVLLSLAFILGLAACSKEAEQTLAPTAAPTATLMPTLLPTVTPDPCAKTNIAKTMKDMGVIK